MSETKRCDERVWENTRWPRPHQCKRMAKVVRDGKHYCNQHDPEAVAAKRKAADEQWEIENRKTQERRRLELAAPNLYSALAAIQFKGHNQLCPVCKGNETCGHGAMCDIGRALAKASPSAGEREG